ncbi:hypothetical protein PYW07_013810 [Mythimna separata]|uniref:Uncharacterized protein n=1 Tax=Mythimna separata TaxID=271217 RepID=A0AAD7YFD9_MYTSE|nr:hypothetical protein PYW07_013810 [Mythimna separata]
MRGSSAVLLNETNSSIKRDDALETAQSIGFFSVTTCEQSHTPSKMIAKFVVVLALAVAAASAGVVAPAALVAPVAPAAYVAPYASSYSAHAVNHAVAAPVVSAPYVAAAPYAAAPYVAAPAAPLVAPASPYFARYLSAPYIL